MTTDEFKREEHTKCCQACEVDDCPPEYQMTAKIVNQCPGFISKSSLADGYFSRIYRLKDE